MNVARSIKRIVTSNSTDMNSSQRQRVALVTGGNKGIGKEVARKLSSAGVKTILGSRSKELGAAAARELQAAGCDVIDTQLDITDPVSVLAAYKFITEEFGGLDILVNNAALCFNDPTLYGKCAPQSFVQQAGPTVATNFFGTLDVTQTMTPLLLACPSPRVVNVVSYAGRLAILRSKDKVETFTSPKLDVESLKVLMKEFVRDVEGGVHAQYGWPNTCYGMSKLGLIALTKVLARDQPGIMVNSVDPGYCATDQNNNRGNDTAEQGARTPAFLALLPDAEFVSGKYFHNMAETRW
jgi:carbonyl reductase 1